MTYDVNFENALHEDKIALSECRYKLMQAIAEMLTITIEECCDFIAETFDNDVEEYSPEDIEQMYIDYCAEYDIPCMQFDYSCTDIMGW